MRTSVLLGVAPPPPAPPPKPPRKPHHVYYVATGRADPECAAVVRRMVDALMAPDSRLDLLHLSGRALDTLLATWDRANRGDAEDDHAAGRVSQLGARCIAALFWPESGLDPECIGVEAREALDSAIAELLAAKLLRDVRHRPAEPDIFED